MADTTQANIKEKGHAPDKSEATGSSHCPHCEDHSRRLGLVEKYLGITPEKGVAKEEGKRKRH